MGVKYDLTGQTFGRLKVASKYEGSKHSEWMCVCSCGNAKIIQSSSLRTGNTQSCGCIQKEKSKARSEIIKKYRGKGYGTKTELQNGW